LILDNGISKVKKWTYSDLLENLDLVERNLKRNDADARLESTVQTTKVKKKSNKRVVADQSEEEVMELDWLTVTTDDQFSKNSIEPVYDLILTVDTLYNPSLSVPLARTISHYATAGTIVLVVTELREPEALELWLGEMLARGWSIARVGDVTHGDARRAWIGWICWMR
jgi:predicted nicotinamide N-methyase